VHSLAIHDEAAVVAVETWAELKEASGRAKDTEHLDRYKSSRQATTDLANGFQCLSGHHFGKVEGREGGREIGLCQVGADAKPRIRFSSSRERSANDREPKFSSTSTADSRRAIASSVRPSTLERIPS
jgi:hypothetical protein